MKPTVVVSALHAYAQSIPLRIVRIRRPAIETARSMANQPNGGLWCSLVVSFCPSLGPMTKPTVRQLVLRDAARPDALLEAFRGWSLWQRSMWVIDETEAQWLVRLAPAFHPADRLEVYWSKDDGPSIEQGAIAPIGNFLNHTAKAAVNDSKIHFDGLMVKGQPVLTDAAKQRLALIDYVRTLRALLPAAARSLMPLLPSAAALASVSREGRGGEGERDGGEVVRAAGEGDGDGGGGGGQGDGGGGEGGGGDATAAVA